MGHTKSGREGKDKGARKNKNIQEGFDKRGSEIGEFNSLAMKVMDTESRQEEVV